MRFNTNPNKIIPTKLLRVLITPFIIQGQGCGEHSHAVGSVHVEDYVAVGVVVGIGIFV